MWPSTAVGKECMWLTSGVSFPCANTSCVYEAQSPAVGELAVWNVPCFWGWESRGRPWLMCAAVILMEGSPPCLPPLGVSVPCTSLVGVGEMLLLHCRRDADAQYLWRDLQGKC